MLDDILSKEEMELFQEALRETMKKKADMKEAKQIREIVPIEEWLENPYYVGPDGANLYPYWKEELIDVFGTNKNKYSEIIVTGSIGTGKSTFSIFAMLRKIYELSCYENVSALFDLMSTSLIVFIYFSVNKTQAELTGFGQFKSLIDSIPYFNENFSRNKKVNSVIQLPENLLFTYGSDTQHAIGMNMLGAILDEANFHQGDNSPNKASKKDYSKIANLYSSIVNRAKSRFADKDEDHSLSILVSSATHSSSFTSKRIEESVDDPSTKIIDAKLWEVKPQKYSSEKFYTFTGSEMLDPYIVEDVNDINEFLESIGRERLNREDYTIEQALQKVPEHRKELFVAVPTDFKTTFKNDLIKALQDIAGVSVAPLGRLFSSRPVYNDAIQAGHEKGLKHPFYKDEFVISTGDNSKVQDYLRKGFTFQNRNKPRFIHIDQSTSNDSTGISMCHISDVKEKDGVRKPIVSVDFILKINPPKAPKQISISKIRDFVFYLRDNMGLNIAKVSYDWFACLSAGHKVPTDNGIYNIEDIEVGQEVLTRKGYKEVTNKFQYEDAPVLEVITKSGRKIEGTPKHKILVFDKWDYTGYSRTPVWKWKRLDEIELRDIVYTEMLETDKEEYVELEGAGEKVKYSQGKMCGFEMPDYLDEELAYIIAYYLGDGRMGEDGISFTFNGEGEFNRFSKRVKDYFDYDMYMREGSGNGKCGGFYSRQFIRFLKANGIAKQTGLYKSIPEIIWKSPKSVIASFVAGLVDSDGSVDKEDTNGFGRIQFTSHSKDLAYGLQKLLMLGLGIKATVSETEPMKYKDENSLIKQCAEVGYQLKTVGDRTKLHKIPSWKIQENLSEIEGRNIYDRVVEINEDKADVFDIEVEEESAYYANGFYSHNSQESRQILNEQGIDAEHRSVDKKDEAYLSLVRLFFENRVHLYRYVPFEEELFELIHDRTKRKVDHPAGGTKDAADGVAGAVMNALESDMADSADSDSSHVVAQVNNDNYERDNMFSVEELLGTDFHG